LREKYWKNVDIWNKKQLPQGSVFECFELFGGKYKKFWSVVKSLTVVTPGTFGSIYEN